MQQPTCDVWAPQDCSLLEENNNKDLRMAYLICEAHRALVGGCQDCWGLDVNERRLFALNLLGLGPVGVEGAVAELKREHDGCACARPFVKNLSAPRGKGYAPSVSV